MASVTTSQLRRFFSRSDQAGQDQVIESRIGKRISSQAVRDQAIGFIIQGGRFGGGFTLMKMLLLILDLVKTAQVIGSQLMAMKGLSA